MSAWGVPSHLLQTGMDFRLGFVLFLIWCCEVLRPVSQGWWTCSIPQCCRTAPVVANWWHSSCKKLTDTFLAGRDRGVQQALRGRRSPHRRKRWCLQQYLGPTSPSVRLLMVQPLYWSKTSSQTACSPVPSCHTNGWVLLLENSGSPSLGCQCGYPQAT